MSDVNVEIGKIQKEIIDKLGMSGENVIFDFSSQEKIVKLNLITINPRHEQSFLYHSVKAISKLEALQKMLEYINSNNKTENTYTIQWRKVGQQELHTSYFIARNMYEALDKFYYQREINSFNIFSITLNPVA
ncbi:MAG: hypothetical protein R2836_03415 [Chitinophagales bacterium]|nr:hypothetical protein [Bacteroidota bacterium]MCB9226148.1 hypothetical protein [Chitinophagales bacterium]